MTLCDTGPLVALIDRDDPHHTRCAAALETLPPDPLVTTIPCLVEAMYLLDRAGGSAAQESLWDFIDDELVVLDLPEPEDWHRMRALMRQYHDAPMDLADASLVAAAERLVERRIFTLDSHFYAYRIAGDMPFEVLP